jgi:hypothetical protein
MGAITNCCSSKKGKIKDGDRLDLDKELTGQMEEEEQDPDQLGEID